MKRKIIHKGKWLSFGEVEFTTKSGKIIPWEFATRERTTGSACIVAIRKGNPDTIVLVKQFRPPIGAEIIEFPAGLFEEGHTARETAIKELREETGCSGIVIGSGPSIYNTPGMTDENTCLVVVEVTDRTEQAQDEHEDIEVLELPLPCLRQSLIDLAAQGVRIDAKLWSFAEGLAFADTRR